MSGVPNMYRSLFTKLNNEHMKMKNNMNYINNRALHDGEDKTIHILFPHRGRVIF